MKTANEVEKEFLLGLDEKYSRSLKAWMQEIKTTGLNKQKEIHGWLKSEKGLKHRDAWMLAAIYLNNGKPVYGDESDLLGNQLAKYENVRTLFDFVSEQILTTVEKSEREVKKTYVSFKKKREFAAVNIRKNEIRLGMDLGDEPFDHNLQKAKLTGPMARISHMVVIRSENDFSKQIKVLLKKSAGRIT